MKEFESIFLGKFISDSLGDLSQKYISDCESYDKKICKYRNKYNIAIPMNKDEYGVIYEHAKKLKEDLLIEVKARGCTLEDFNKSIKREISRESE